MQTVWLEFKHEAGNIAANGTDTTFFIDGRWKWETTRQRIEEKLSALRSGPFGSRYSKQLFVGITYSQQPFHNGKGGAIHTMSDPNPPAWSVDDLPNPNVDCGHCITPEDRCSDISDRNCASAS